jgi:hypothetical protein
MMFDIAKTHFALLAVRGHGVTFRIADDPRTGCVVTQLGLGYEANWVRGIANASRLHIGKYRAEPA